MHCRHCGNVAHIEFDHARKLITARCKNPIKGTPNGSCYAVARYYKFDSSAPLTNSHNVLTELRKAWNKHQKDTTPHYLSCDNDYYEADKEVIAKFGKCDWENFEHRYTFYSKIYYRACSRYAVELGKYRGYVRKLLDLNKIRKEKIQSLQSEIQRLNSKIKTIEENQ